LFILNPGAGLATQRFTGVRTYLKRRGIAYSAAATTGPGDARELATLAGSRGYRAIVCVGGDGTVNEVVNGLATPEGEIDQRAVLGVIPAGTARDFARSVGLPLRREAALDRLLAGQETRVDVGRIRFADGRFHLFVNVLGAGFDAEVAERAQDVRGAISSIPAHVVGFASALADYQNKEISIAFDDWDDRALNFRCSMVVVANGPSYAGVMRFAPSAVVDDGLLDVVVVGDITNIEILLNLPRVVAGTHLNHQKVAAYRVPALRLESEDGALVQADGEVVGQLPARVDILPRALRLIR
jgi:YegS/Rv2252/BmrU family lipid kinase